MPDLNVYSILMMVVFIFGYVLITIEHSINVSKSAIAMITAIFCWIIQFAQAHYSGENVTTALGEHVSQIAQIVFFLLGALIIVETISLHNGFAVLTNSIAIRSKRKLLWLMCTITFFLSAILDNLTTTIVMITLLSDLIESGEDRLLLGGAVVIAANAGGAWTPIGDVTTTMLWIGGQVSTFPIMRDLFLPSIVCMIVSLVIITFMLKGNFQPKSQASQEKVLQPMGKVIFFLGIGLLMFVPIFKTITGLPPFMGMLLGVSILWLVTDIFHNGQEDLKHLKMHNVLSRADHTSILFFLGILLCISALQEAGLLNHLAAFLNNTIGNITVIATVIGLISAVIDNVPLVAATMGMYSLENYPQDAPLWQLIAYCAGTGGSVLIIGSAAGIVFMGLEKVNFFWYLKRISLPALVGYLAGVLVYLVL